MNSPLITTIIPTYRRPQLLRKAIFSALNQTISNIKVCVYDNASGDETEKIVKEIIKTDPRVEYHCHPHLIEAAHNFQYGLSCVTTPFFSLLADDDLLASDCYETALLSMNQFPNASFFLGSTLDIKANGHIISASALQWGKEEFYAPPFGLYEVIKNYYNWTGALFRSDILNSIQIDPLVKAIDLDFVLRAASQFLFVISKKPCAVFIHHKTSYSNHCGLKLIWPSWTKIVQNIESIEPLSSTEKAKAKDLMNAKLQKMFLSILIVSISEKKFEQANKVIAVFLKEFPQNAWPKIFHFLLPYIEKTPGIYSVFKILLTLLRIKKTLRIQIKYRNFSKSLLNQFYENHTST